MQQQITTNCDRLFECMNAIVFLEASKTAGIFFMEAP